MLNVKQGARTCALSLILAGGSLALAFQSAPDPECPTRTGGSAVVIVPENAALDPLEVGDRIYAQDPTGDCAGGPAVWDGDGVALTVWEDDPFTPERDGLFHGDPLRMVVDRDGTITPVEHVVWDESYGAPADSGYYRDALWVVAVGAPVGTEPDPETAPLTVYPNPSLASVRFTRRVDVYDALGRHVARVEPGSPLRGLAPGVYVARSGPDSRRFTVVR